MKIAPVFSVQLGKRTPAEELGEQGDDDGAEPHRQGKQPLPPVLRPHLEELADLRDAHDDHLQGTTCLQPFPQTRHGANCAIMQGTRSW